MRTVSRANEQGPLFNNQINVPPSVAMRIEGDPVSTNNGVYYFLADHLGSTSVTLDANGAKIGEMKYYPFGETRYVNGALGTDRRYTGQREENGLGSLYDYGARLYSPAIGRFISADIIVPEPGNPQSLNRYAYGLNNPLRYVDPSGHFETDADLATYLGFKNVDEMYNSSLWASWSKNDAWMAMVRSTAFDFGGVLVGEANGARFQAMLIERDGNLALWSWNDSEQPTALTRGGLDYFFQADKWALFSNSDFTKGLEQNYRLAASDGKGGAALSGPSGLDGSNWNRGPHGHVEISPRRKGDAVLGTLKILGGAFAAAKGATMVTAGIAGAPETFGASLLAVAPGSMVFAGGLATFGSGVQDVIGRITGMNAKFVWDKNWD
jgi:RHS repeat-associated protein